MTKKNTHNAGRLFEQNFENSIEESGLWSFRVRDVNPMAIKRPYRIPRNPYDQLIFNGEYLFALELKSTQAKSMSHRGSNPQIKEHQTDALKKASNHKNVIAGLVLNFRSDNKTYFIHINDFINYDLVSKGEKESTYKNKVNRKSIPIDICKEIGIEILSIKKRVHYRYFINEFIQSAIYSYQRR